MNKLIRPLAVSAAFGCAGLAGLNHLLADGKAPPAPAAEKPAAATPAAPVTITPGAVETKFAVTPKDLTDSVKKGLEFLVKSQQEDGGWNQGGGWRTAVNGQGGRIEGAKVEDPSDVGNTCITLLALIRAGHTPTEGAYKEQVKKGLQFVFTKIEKSDADSLYVTDVRNTQLQSKIGPYVDTFLANLVLAELKGKAGGDEKRLVACLEKTMTKIVKHQTADGQIAGNGGWAPVLSLALCNKSLVRAKLNGVAVDDKVIAQAQRGSEANAAGKPVAAAAGEVLAAAPAATGPPVAARPTSGTVASGPAAATKPAEPGKVPAGVPAAPAADSVALRRTTDAPAVRFAAPSGGPGGGGFGGGDAGVRLYSLSQGAGNYQDVVNSLRVDGKKAMDVLKDAKATDKQKEEAKGKLAELEKAETRNGEIQRDLVANVRNEQFVAGFGSNGGEEFLSFLNISETLVLKGGKEWDEWDGKMRKAAEKAQDKDGSWAGHHCITGKNFCTAGALLVMMADRTPFPVDVIAKEREKAKEQPKPAAPEKK